MSALPPTLSFSESVVATAHALMIAGYSLRRTEQELRQRFPDEPVPSFETISRWRNDVDMTQHFKEREDRIAARMDGILDDILSQVEAGEKDLKPVAAFTMWGIARTKQHERAQRTSPTINVSNYVIVPASQLPQDTAKNTETENPALQTEFIEGKSRLKPEPGTGVMSEPGEDSEAESAT